MHIPEHGERPDVRVHDRTVEERSINKKKSTKGEHDTFNLRFEHAHQFFDLVRYEAYNSF
jgi:hypothetical protein